MRYLTDGCDYMGHTKGGALVMTHLHFILKLLNSLYDIFQDAVLHKSLYSSPIFCFVVAINNVRQSNTSCPKHFIGKDFEQGNLWAFPSKFVMSMITGDFTKSASSFFLSQEHSFFLKRRIICSLMVAIFFPLREWVHFQSSENKTNFLFGPIAIILLLGYTTC